MLNLDLLKYWLKIQDKNNPNTQLQQFYNQQYEDNIPVNNINWTFHVNRSINEIEHNLNVAFFSLFQQNQFIQQWKSEIKKSSRFKYYNKYKTELCIEQYLLNSNNDKLRTQLAQFRLSAHKLAIEARRFQNIDREQRLCTFCNQHQIETEFHF